MTDPTHCARYLAWLDRAFGRSAARWFAYAAVTAAALVTVVYPLFVARYAPITDLPMHATNASILWHYTDPSFGFQEQFQLALLGSMYWLQMGLTVLFLFLVPIAAAAKLATAVCFLLLPAGLAVLFAGLGKSPWLGLTGLGLVWTNISHWGFINHVAALGFFAMTIGFALMAAKNPRPRVFVGLAAALFGVMISHVFRFPYALGSVLAVAVVFWRRTRSWRIVLATVPAVSLFVIWWFKRDCGEAGDIEFAFHSVRLKNLPAYLFDNFKTPGESTLAWMYVASIAILVAAGLLARRHLPPEPDRFPTVAGHLLVAFFAFVSFLLFLVMPQEIGNWWVADFREATTPIILLLALIPDLPRRRIARVACLSSVLIATTALGLFVGTQFQTFVDDAEAFYEITRGIPKASRLGYMIFDHTGTTKNVTPFVHLPAWVQAEKGGAISFHFNEMGFYPIQYKKGSPAVPPPTPGNFEWNPHRFDIKTRGAFFDWFLVRSKRNPSARFAADPSIEMVANIKRWWLYRRSPLSP